MEFKFDKRFTKKLQGRFNKYEFQVGVLDDGIHYDAKRGIRGAKGQDVVKQYAGGPVRQSSNSDSGKMISDISHANSERLGFNYILKPFKDKNSDIIKFSTLFFRMAFGKGTKRQCENLLQAIVRNPILRGEYGPQGALTTAIKTFNRPMIDTAQLFKAIKAKCTVRGS